jgi:hypothetical protein
MCNCSCISSTLGVDVHSADYTASLIANSHMRFALYDPPAYVLLLCTIYYVLYR